MYDYAKRGAAPSEAVITDAWKYSATSSSGHKVLAALKSFGLVEDSSSGGNKAGIKLTNRAIRILLDDQDSPEKREEIRKAALSPKWYDYCWRTWGRDMPPSMKSNLLVEHGFVDSTVEGFLKDYRKTVAFAGLLDDSELGNDDTDDYESAFGFTKGEYVQWESQGVLRMPAAKRLTHFSDDGNYAFVEGSPTGIPVEELIEAAAPEDAERQSAVKSSAIHNPLVLGGSKVQLDTVNLAEGITLQFQWPSTITPDTYEDFLYQLEGIKRRIGRSVQKASIETQGAKNEEEH
jgi:hypothetical protein